MSLIKLKCLGGDVYIEKNDIIKDTFLSALIKWQEATHSNEYSVSEPRDIVSNLMASIKYGVIIDDNVSLKHMYLLAKSWCFPEGILDQLDNMIAKKLENEKIYKCINCHAGFKESENTNTSCKSHTNQMHGGTYLFNCCGKNIDNPCCIGYHIK